MQLPRRKFFKRLGLLFGTTQLPKLGAAEARPESPASPHFEGGHLPMYENIKASFDLLVVGGGISGTSAAISAARNGMKVALVHERSMLGGNSSSEVNLFPEDNAVKQPWIKETGIIEEFHVEERLRNHAQYREGLMNCHWDLVLYEWATREKNLTLFLNTHMHRVEMENNHRIRSINGIQLGTEKAFTISAPLFVDATGDGVLGYRAGAEFRWGREGKSEYHEPLAPEQPDEKVMGNTLFFRAVDLGKRVPFKLPDWAVSFPKESDLTSRGHGYIEAGYWWIEVGAPLHPISDNEAIRHEALRQLLGVWDHIKNRGDHGAENFALEFVGFWPYKREARRILGDYVVTQPQVQNPQLLSDAVAFGAWGIDIHVQGGILARHERPYEPPAGHNYELLGTMPYSIPLRSLYSRKVENLMMAGRPISASYVGFASTRVLSTGSIVGQAVGVAASLCQKYKTTPRRVADLHARECQQIILRQDGHIIGVKNEDASDLARQAKVSASSESGLVFPEGTTNGDLNWPHAQLFPVTADRIDRVQLLVASKNTAATELKIGLRAAPHVWDFRSTEDLASAAVMIPAGHHGWVTCELNAKVIPEQLYYIHTAPCPGVIWKMFGHHAGQPLLCPVGTSPAHLPGKSRWETLSVGRGHCMKLEPECRPYTANNVIRGTHRPDTWTNIWISDPQQPLPATLELQWSAPKEFNLVQITFDTNAIVREIQPLFRYPDCVKDYDLEAGTGGVWKTIASIRDNYMRRRVHQFDAVRADQLRLKVLATNGAPTARVFEIRVYNEA